MSNTAHEAVADNVEPLGSAQATPPLSTMHGSAASATPNAMEDGAEHALASRVEAVLLVADRPLSAERIAAVLKLIRLAEEATDKGEGSEQTIKPTGRPSSPVAVAQACKRIGSLVERLNLDYDRSGRAFRIEQVAGGYRVMTLPAFAETIAEFHRTKLSGKLTRAAVETLAIIAYKQPITRAQLEAIRGVSCGEVLRSLMDRRIITITGRAEELGRPMLYGTTKQFLQQFGLSSIGDLPTLAELRPTP